MDKDKYGEIINGICTYSEIINQLKQGKSVIIGWTDEKYTHLDLLFSSNIYKQGTLQRGLRGNELFVSIISIGSFGFDIKNREIYKGYIAEKLNIHGEPTISKLAELINEVIKGLI